MILRVGAILYGTCGGVFRDSYGENRIEAIGADWVVVRDDRGRPQCEAVDPEDLVEYLTKPEDWVDR
jgi:hypothetical protein